MCRDGYYVKCVIEDCTIMVNCRDYTMCFKHREGTEEDYW